VFLEDIVFEVGVSGCEIMEKDFAFTYRETFNLFLADSDFQV
jgi:hypothetical protein